MRAAIKKLRRHTRIDKLTLARREDPASLAIADIRFDPPLAFLTECSGKSLGEFLLSRLNRSANLRKQIHALEDALRIAESEAIFARWLIQHRGELIGFFQSEGERRFRAGSIDPVIFARWLLEHREELIEFLRSKGQRTLQSGTGSKP
jgi:hypothetical protein